MLCKIFLFLLLTALQQQQGITTKSICTELVKKIEKFVIVIPDGRGWMPPKKVHLTREKMVEVNVCCPGYRQEAPEVCLPICDQKRCGPHQECIEPNECGCTKGYEPDAKNPDSCVPKCQKGCQPHAHCEAPDVCVCDEAYIKSNDDQSTCVPRCRQGVDWDPQTQTCVQRMQGDVAVIAAEVNLLMPDLQVPRDEADEEKLTKSDGSSAARNSNCSSTDGDICLNLNPNPFLRPSGFDIPQWMSCINVTIGLGVISLLVLVGLVARYLWKRRLHDNAVILEAKNRMCGEYVLDRSQILVY